MFANAICRRDVKSFIKVVLGLDMDLLLNVRVRSSKKSIDEVNASNSGIRLAE